MHLYYIILHALPKPINIFWLALMYPSTCKTIFDYYQYLTKYICKYNTFNLMHHITC